MKVVSTSNAPAAIGPYSQALDLGSMVFVSGQIPVDPATGTMADTVEEQAAQSLANLKAILAEAGLTMANVVKTVIFLADINDFAAVNAVYAKAFTEPFPARSCVQVAAIPKGAKLEIECIADGRDAHLGQLVGEGQRDGCLVVSRARAAQQIGKTLALVAEVEGAVRGGVPGADGAIGCRVRPVEGCVGGGCAVVLHGVGGSLCAVVYLHGERVAHGGDRPRRQRGRGAVHHGAPAGRQRRDDP